MWWSPGQMCFLTRVQAHTNIWRSSMNVFLTVSINTHVDTFTNTHTHYKHIHFASLLFVSSVLSLLISSLFFSSCLLSSLVFFHFICFVLVSFLFLSSLLFITLFSSLRFVFSLVSSVLLFFCPHRCSCVHLPLLYSSSLARSLSTPPVGVVLLG